MDKHKKRCKQLKEIRKNIADKLNIDLHQTECTFKGECSGTCPKCQQEEKILNKALLGKGAAIGAATLMAASMTACITPPDEATTGIVAPDFDPTEQQQEPTNQNREKLLKELKEINEKQKNDKDDDDTISGDVEILGDMQVITPSPDAHITGLIEIQE